MNPLRKFRKAVGITQEELAAYLGVKQGYVSQVENGVRPISKETVRRIKGNPEWKDSADILSGYRKNEREELLVLRREVEFLRAQNAELLKVLQTLSGQFCFKYVSKNENSESVND